MNRDMQDYSPPPSDRPVLPPEITPPAPEFPPQAVPVNEDEAPSRRRRLRFLLYAAAALVYLGLLFRPGGAKTPTPAAEPLPTAPVETAAPAAEPTPLPTAPAEPLSRIPRIETDFFCFSHEHHARVYLSNTDAVESVEVSVRDKTLDLGVFDAVLSEEEIAAGVYELPMLSTGDLYMEHMAEYEAAGTPIPGTDYVSSGWPAFEMTVSARYQADDGEALIRQTVEPVYELGFGFSYWRYDWDEQIPQFSFRVIPWEETDELRYVVNDPDAVKNPLTVSVDVSYNGRHAAPEEYETLLYREEYSILNRDTGEYEPTVGCTAQLLLRRPDWMPEKGTVHVVIVQKLASTGELWTREFDYDYGPD